MIEGKPIAPKDASSPTAWRGYVARLQTEHMVANPKATPTEARRAVYPRVLNQLLTVAPQVLAARFLGPEPV